MFRCTARPAGSFAAAVTLLVAASASDLAAQTALSCKTEVGSWVQLNGNRRGSYHPRGTRIPSTLRTQASYSAGASSVTASTVATIVKAGATSRISVAENGRIDSTLPVQATAATYNRVQSYSLRDPRPRRKYRIDVTYDNSLTTGAWARATVDLDANGRPEFDARARTTKQFTITTGDAGLSCTFLSAGRADSSTPGQRGYSATLRIDVTDLGALPRCVFRSIGPSCGPRLSATEGQPAATTPITFRTTGAKPNSNAMLMVGIDDTSLKIPGTSCFVLVDGIVVSLAHAIDARGEGSITLQLPPAVRASAVLQNAVYRSTPSGLELATSNAIGMTCGR